MFKTLDDAWFWRLMGGRARSIFHTWFCRLILTFDLDASWLKTLRATKTQQPVKISMASLVISPWCMDNETVLILLYVNSRFLCVHLRILNVYQKQNLKKEAASLNVLVSNVQVLTKKALKRMQNCCKIWIRLTHCT